jgi:outer membrane protein assembly factor BamD (BamD/ComL family)
MFIQRRNKLFLLVVIALLFVSGCSTISGVTDTGMTKRETMERNFAGALQHMQKGNEQKAGELLENVVRGPLVQGITDEALFRLALLKLRDSGSGSVLRAEKLLERLRKEFPRSIWRYQSEPLIAFIEASAEQRKSQKELRSLRELNVSLTRNNKELRQTIERLKELDIELENKIRR